MDGKRIPFFVTNIIFAVLSFGFAAMLSYSIGTGSQTGLFLPVCGLIATFAGWVTYFFRRY
jgi:hypothetical protein